MRGRVSGEGGGRQFFGGGGEGTIIKPGGEGNIFKPPIYLRIDVIMFRV